VNKYVLASLLCPVFGLSASTPTAPETPLGDAPLLGGYQAASSEAPLVQEAKSFIQKQFATMNLRDVTEAYVQVVAGLNVRFRCAVQAEDGCETWEFLAFRSLDGRWHFQSASRL